MTTSSIPAPAIIKRPSSGRGEYEATGFPNEKKSPHLNQPIRLEGIFGTKSLALEIRLQGNKSRLRITKGKAGTPRHVAPFLSALLMMPECTRSETNVATTLPVLQSGKYILDVGFSDNQSKAGKLYLSPSILRARGRSLSDSHEHLIIPIKDRLQKIELVYSNAAIYPDKISEQINRHKSGAFGNDDAAYKLCRNATDALIEALPAHSDAYIPNSDPLPELLDLIGEEYATTDIPTPDETEPTLEIRTRAHQQALRRIRKPRGNAARKFAQEVILAYDHKCLFCGFDGRKTASHKNNEATRSIPSPIEAAHILPWATYDLDDVRNGIALCRFHHWAFDSGVITLAEEQGTYSIAPGPHFNAFDVSTEPNEGLLQDILGLIDDSRLPKNVAQRPAAEVVRKYNDTFDVPDKP